MRKSGGMGAVRGRDSDEVSVGNLSRACCPGDHRNNALLAFKSKSDRLISFMAHHTAPIKHLMNRLTAQSDLLLDATAVQSFLLGLLDIVENTAASVLGE